MKRYKKVLKDVFKFDSFQVKQIDAIDAVIRDKRDTCVIMFTGAGKSLCYQFPPIYTNKTVLVVSPLISLMNDQKLKMEELGIAVACLNSTVCLKNIIKKDILDGKYSIVYTTPEHIVKAEEFLKELCVKDILVLVAIDESHCVSKWGHDFRDSYRKLNCLKKWLPNIPVMALTATATPAVEKDIIKSLGLVNPKIIKTTFDRPNLTITIKVKSSDIMDDIYPLVKANRDKGDMTIIYCQKRKETEKISKLLKKREIKVDTYHAGMGAIEREIVHNDFVQNNISCVVATIAFGMGIDKVVRTVIHYGIPREIESYYQEIGRAGRDGKKSYCYLFYSLSSINAMDFFINKIRNDVYREHKMKLCTTIKKFIFNTECRRKYILEYFGEEYNVDNCNNCDNCINKKVNKSYDFTDEAKLLLETIYDTGGMYGGTMIINILRGSKSKKIPFKYKKYTNYGKGAYRSTNWWKVFIRLMITHDYLMEKSIHGCFGFTVSRTIKGSKLLNNISNGQNLTLPVSDEFKLLIECKVKLGASNSVSNSVSSSGKVPTHMITSQMFQNGKTISQIAKERKMKARTVEDHIVKSYEGGSNVDLDRLGFTDNMYTTISNKIIELDNPTRLRMIKQHLPYNISYLQIRIALAKMKKGDQGIENAEKDNRNLNNNFDDCLNNNLDDSLDDLSDLDLSDSELDQFEDMSGSDIELDQNVLNAIDAELENDLLDLDSSKQNSEFNKINLSDKTNKKKMGGVFKEYDDLNLKMRETSDRYNKLFEF